jgi:tetratricopeptide (TPR) repeat protein
MPSENLEQGAGPQPVETLKRLLAQIRAVQQKSELAGGGAEAIDQKSPTVHAAILEVDCVLPNTYPTDQSPFTVGLAALLDQGKQQFEKGDFAACSACMREVHRLDPDNAEAEWFLTESTRQIEEQLLREELEIHTENVKKQAMDSFDQQRYEECVGMFQFLCELEPDNRKLQDYLDLSRQFARETETSREKAGQTLAPGISQETVPEILLKGETAAGLSSGAVAEPTQVEGVRSRNCQLEAARDADRRNSPAAPLAQAKGAVEPSVLSSKSRCSLGKETARDVEVEIKPSHKFSRKKRWAVLLVSATVLLLAAVKSWLLPHRWLELTHSPAVPSDLGQAPGEAASIVPSLTERNAKGMANLSEGSGPESTTFSGGGSSGSLPVENPVRPAQQPALNYAVIHDHLLGSCIGRLRLDSKSIAFLPSADSKDGFNFQLADITGTELGDHLKIRFNNKIYRFKASLARNKEDNRRRLNAVYQQLVRFRAGSP